MDTPAPQVTVLMPVRNGAAHLAPALASIFAQTFADFELLVIDDGSTDATADILRACRDPRLRVVENAAALGLVPSLNRGLELARGELVARQDHDDVSRADRLEMQVAFLRRQPDVALVGSEAWAMDEQGRRGARMLRPLSAEGVRWYLCFDNAFIHSSVMFRREVIARELGGYRPSLHSEDYELWSRLARVRPTANLPEPLLSFREHTGSATGGLSAAAAAAFDEATSAIRLENLRHLPGAAARPEDALLLANYRRPLTADSAGEFLGVFERLLETRRAEMRASPDLRRTVAIQLGELAYRLLPVSRGLALRLFVRAFRWHLPVAAAVPWSRALALFLLGDRARTLFLKLTAGR